MIVLNGKMIEQKMIHLDRGFLFGCGVFETIFIKEGRPIFLREHLERLNRGLKTLKIQRQLNEGDTLLAIEKLQPENCALRISVSDENVLFTKRELPYKKEDYDKGFSLKVSEITRNPKSHTTYIKSLNYIDNGLEKEKALEAGFNEAIFLNGEGIVTEGCTANLFWIRDNTLYTPSVDCGLLEGVMRHWVNTHYPVIQGKFSLEQVLSSEGVFLTNSLMGIMKVHRIEAKEFKHNPLIQSLQGDYSKYLEAYCYE